MGKLFPVESWHAAPETLSKMQLATVTFTTRFVPGAGPAVEDAATSNRLENAIPHLELQYVATGCVRPNRTATNSSPGTIDELAVIDSCTESAVCPVCTEEQGRIARLTNPAVSELIGVRTLMDKNRLPEVRLGRSANLNTFVRRSRSDEASINKKICVRPDNDCYSGLNRQTLIVRNGAVREQNVSATIHAPKTSPETAVAAHPRVSPTNPNTKTSIDAQNHFLRSLEVFIVALQSLCALVQSVVFRDGLKLEHCGSKVKQRSVYSGIVP